MWGLLRGESSLFHYAFPGYTHIHAFMCPFRESILCTLWKKEVEGPHGFSLTSTSMYMHMYMYVCMYSCVCPRLYASPLSERR